MTDSRKDALARMDWLDNAIIMAIATVAKSGDFIRKPTDRERAIYRAGMLRAAEICDDMDDEVYECYPSHCAAEIREKLLGKTQE